MNWIEALPHVNVCLNGTAAVLLLLGKVLIHKKQEKLHKLAMYAAFVVSAVFLSCYLTYHFNVPTKRFPTDESIAPAWARYTYYGILLSHVLLAISVPYYAIASIYYGITDQREKHRKLVHWGWPIWFYVSVTGVIVYLMLYQIYATPTAT